jgi:hypothetical protein
MFLETEDRPRVPVLRRVVEGVEQEALVSRCEQYRYWLRRCWDRAGEVLVFVALNPSTADASVDDPTLRKMMTYARTWGYGAVEVVNLFAWRSPDPEMLPTAAAPVGPDNDWHIAQAVRYADRVVLAWGNHGELLRRGHAVLQLVAALGLPRERFWSFPRNRGKGQHPPHPLYLKGDLAILPFALPEVAPPAPPSSPPPAALAPPPPSSAPPGDPLPAARGATVVPLAGRAKKGKAPPRTLLVLGEVRTLSTPEARPGCFGGYEARVCVDDSFCRQHFHPCRQSSPSPPLHETP